MAALLERGRANAADTPTRRGGYLSQCPHAHQTHCADHVRSPSILAPRSSRSRLLGVGRQTYSEGLRSDEPLRSFRLRSPVLVRAALRRTWTIARMSLVRQPAMCSSGPSPPRHEREQHAGVASSWPKSRRATRSHRSPTPPPSRARGRTRRGGGPDPCKNSQVPGCTLTARNRWRAKCVIRTPCHIYLQSFRGPGTDPGPPSGTPNVA